MWMKPETYNYIAQGPSTVANGISTRRHVVSANRPYSQLSLLSFFLCLSFLILYMHQDCALLCKTMPLSDRPIGLIGTSAFQAIDITDEVVD